MNEKVKCTGTAARSLAALLTLSVVWPTISHAEIYFLFEGECSDCSAVGLGVGEIAEGLLVLPDGTATTGSLDGSDIQSFAIEGIGIPNLSVMDSFVNFEIEDVIATAGFFEDAADPRLKFEFFIAAGWASWIGIDPLEGIGGPSGGGMFTRVQKPPAIPLPGAAPLALSALGLLIAAARRRHRRALYR